MKIDIIYVIYIIFYYWTISSSLKLKDTQFAAIYFYYRLTILLFLYLGLGLGRKGYFTFFLNNL